MVWIWLLLSCLLTWLPPTPGQDIYHTRSKAWFTQKMKRPDSFFGYSITYVSDSKRLIVSAPQADDIGQIYSCEIESQECASVPRNITRQNPEYKHNYWLGAVVKGGTSSFVTCAPLLTELHGYLALKENKTNYHVGTFSHCYKYPSPTKLPNQLDSLTPDVSHQHTTVFEQTMLSFGWSIDVADDDIIIGGPAMFTGRAIKYSGKKNRIIGLSGQIDTRTAVEYDFGYSVAVGYFKRSGNNFRSYAVSSPYGTKGHAKIIFYLDNSNGLLNYSAELSPTDLEAEVELKRVPVGSSFGAALCAARLSPAKPTRIRLTRPTALVVGAPTFALDHQYNRGAVFIYAPEKNFATDFKRRIVGEKDGSHFGSAIVNLGDLNGDTMDEIAIGAPYEDSGAGAVYVYSSNDITSDKETIVPQQRIVAESKGLRSFGLSLTALQDYDENGCNELAIGAPESDKVMLLKCIATVTVKLHEKINITKNKVDRIDTHFQFQSCLEVSYPDKPAEIHAEIKVLLQITHPDAKLANSADKELIIVLNKKKGKDICRHILVETPEGGGGIPIKYTITAEQLHPPSKMDNFEAKRVGLSDRSVLTSSHSIYIADCHNPVNCMPDLKYLGTDRNDEPYMIGSTKTLTLTMVFRNEGEMAYNARLVVVVSDATVSEMSPDCTRDSGTTLSCEPKQRLKTNAIWNTTVISLDTTRLTNELNNITIHMYLYNEWTDNKNHKEFQKVIPLIADPKGIFVKGITDSGPDNMVNMTNADIVLGRTFEQSYTIANNGKFDWGGLTVQVEIQKRHFVVISSVVLSTAISPTGPPECKMINETDSDISYTCNLAQLLRNQLSKLIVYMIIQPEVMDSVIENKENSVYSHFTVKYSNDELKESSVTTTFHVKDPVVPLWVVLAASLIGLIILFIIFFILRECGFFRREKKENLERVQKQVKRQTIMRKSMMEGVRLPPGTDNEHLITEEAEPQVADTTDKRIRVPSS